MLKTVLIGEMELYDLSRRAVARVGRFALRAKGHSMSPFLKSGDMVVIAAAHNYRIGDIVFGKAGGKILLHRVIHCLDDRVITRGDARLDSQREIMLISDIVGRVVEIEGKTNVFSIHWPVSYLVARWAGIWIGFVWRCRAIQKNIPFIQWMFSKLRQRRG